MEEKNPQPAPRRSGNHNQALIFRLAGAVLVLYWLFGIVKSYVEGGTDAPSLTLLIIACAVMGGGAILVALLAWRTWKKAKEEENKSEEE